MGLYSSQNPQPAKPKVRLVITDEDCNLKYLEVKIRKEPTKEKGHPSPPSPSVLPLNK